MKSFRWDKNFETGLLEVDQQHYYLVDLINQLGDQLAANNLDEENIERLFKELFEYSVYHFQEEEELMSEVGIDQRHLEFHVEEHHHFLQEVKMLHSNISSMNPDEVKHLLDFLIHWLAYHILGCDQNMSRQILAIQAGASAEDAYKKEEHKTDNATKALVSSLSNLFQIVAVRNQELEQLNQSLEAKVAERTQALAKANHDLEELASTDVLTHLPNRRHGMRRLDHLWQESLKAQIPIACMMIDADHFKEVNDTYGHEAGDAVLQALARTLKHSVRNDDVVCRLGGDEFFIVCPHTDHGGSLHIAELVRQSVSALCVPTGEGVWHGSVSIGVAVRTAEMETPRDLIRAADNAVYTAKRAGRNCVRQSSSMNSLCSQIAL